MAGRSSPSSSALSLVSHLHTHYCIAAVWPLLTHWVVNQKALLHHPKSKVVKTSIMFCLDHSSAVLPNYNGSRPKVNRRKWINTESEKKVCKRLRKLCIFQDTSFSDSLSVNSHLLSTLYCSTQNTARTSCNAVLLKTVSNCHHSFVTFI